MFYLLFVKLRECLLKMLIFFTSLFVTLLDIFDFYRLNFLQSVPLGLSLLSHFFPNQLLDSFLLRGEAEPGQQQKVVISWSKIVGTMQVEKFAANLDLSVLFVFYFFLDAVKLAKISSHFEVKLLIVRINVKLGLICVL